MDRYRAAKRDRGVFQSAFVGLLVIIVLLITTSLVAFGPKLGSVVADDLICQLLQRQPCQGGGDPDMAGPKGGPGDAGGIGGGKGDPDGGGIAGPKSGSAVIADLKTPGECAAGGQAVDGLFPSGSWSTADFQYYGSQVEVPELPPGTPADLGGQVHVDACGNVVFTSDIDLSNPDDVHADIDWAAIGKTIAAGMAGAAAALVVAGFCAAVPALEPVCPYLWSFTIGFVWNLVSAALNNGGKIDGQGWLNAFVAGLIAATPAAFGKLGPLLAKYVPIWLGALKNAVAAVAKSSWAWLKPYISAAADVVGDFAAAAAKFIRDHPPWGAQQQNLNFAGAFS